MNAVHVTSPITGVVYRNFICQKNSSRYVTKDDYSFLESMSQVSVSTNTGGKHEAVMFPCFYPIPTVQKQYAVARFVVHNTILWYNYRVSNFMG